MTAYICGMVILSITWWRTYLSCFIWHRTKHKPQNLLPDAYSSVSGEYTVHCSTLKQKSEMLGSPYLPGNKRWNNDTETAQGGKNATITIWYSSALMMMIKADFSLHVVMAKAVIQALDTVEVLLSIWDHPSIEDHLPSPMRTLWHCPKINYTKRRQA